MLKILHSIVIIVFSFSNAISQTLAENDFITPEKTAAKTNENNLSYDSKDNDNVEKDKLPNPYKSSPEIFFIVDDKPVSREEYIKHKEKKQ